MEVSKLTTPANPVEQPSAINPNPPLCYGFAMHGVHLDMVCQNCGLSMPERLPKTCPKCDYVFPTESLIDWCVEKHIMTKNKTNDLGLVTGLGLDDVFMTSIFERVKDQGKMKVDRARFESVIYDAFTAELMSIDSTKVQELAQALNPYLNEFMRDTWRAIKRGVLRKLPKSDYE